MKMSGTCPFCRAKTPTSDEEAVKQLRPWVKKKKAWAQILMSQMYRDGTGVERSYEMARRLKELAAQQGDVGSMYDLASMYAFGEGVKQSYERAKEYYEQAAHLGHASSLYNLGDMYEIGKGVEQSYKRAKEHYEQAAHLGHADSQLNLGVMYHQGQGVEKDNDKARTAWNKAAAQENENALKYLNILDEEDERRTTTTKTSSHTNAIVCSNCNTPQTELDKSIRCPCHSVQYCNKTCQTKHRKNHKKECRKLLAEKKKMKTMNTTKTKQKEEEEEGERKYDEDRTTKLNKQDTEEEGDECPICLENLPKDTTQFIRMTCCGNGLHKHCCKDLHSMNMGGT